ncbi:MAG: hypothetical protein AABW83_02515 [Nanoarchaeota archaeon]
MEKIRNLIDSTYFITKNLLFLMNGNKAHRLFTKFSQLTTRLGLEKFLLDNKDNHKDSLIPISNGAGFNKNVDIPLDFLWHLGFDRVVVGSVTAEPFSGNPEPNIKRFRKTESMVNWMGLPGRGAEHIAENINLYQSKEYLIPITINLTPTPKTTKPLEDLRKTVYFTRDLRNIDRYELNISCPNKDKIINYKEALKEQIEVIESEKRNKQKIYLKVSPDLEEKDIEDILETMYNHNIEGLTTTNTTTFHNSEYINLFLDKGGASGNALYQKSLETQKKFYEKLKDSKLKIIACGGINSKERLIERINYGASEIQIFTPLIFKGPRLIRELRNISL